MDQLDREIEEAAREARRRARQEQLATVASTATFFVVGIAGALAIFGLFPEPDVSEYRALRAELKARGVEPSAASLADELRAEQRDRGRMSWKVYPVMGLALASAFLVRKRLKPKGSS